MAKRKLSFEDNEEDNLNTESVIDNDEPEASADEPLEMPDVSKLQVMELEHMQAEQARAENTHMLKVVCTDGQAVLDGLQASLESYLEACVGKKTSTLRIAAEHLAQAQELAGIGAPEVVQTPAGDVLEEKHLTAALESIGSSISSVIKAIIAAIKKALAFLKQFMKDCWRHLRSLDDAIKREGDTLIAFRKKYKAELNKYSAAQNVDQQRYVQLGHKKSFLTIDGEAPVVDEHIQKDGYAEEFMRMNSLASTSLKYDAFVSALPEAFQKVLDAVSKSVDMSDIDSGDLDNMLKDVPATSTLPHDAKSTVCAKAHGIQAPDYCDAFLSKEYMGNFFQVYIASHSWDLLRRMELDRVEYTHDELQAMANDFMPMLESAEIERVQKAVILQSQTLISMQRVCDAVEHKLDGLTDFLKKVDAQIFQNNQGDATIAAHKNKVLISVTKVISTVEGNCTRFFQDVTSQMRSQQYAWLAYLVANHKREIEILTQGRAAEQAS